MTDNESFKILLLGDFYYGESYELTGAKIIAEKGYSHSTVHLDPFIAASDVFVINLETPIADIKEFPSPFAKQKRWLHWTDTEATGAALRKLGVDGVSLANNHTVDLGAAGLEETFKNLDRFGLPYFGAGRTQKEAEKPFRIAVPENLGGGEIDLHGAYQFSRVANEAFQAYAYGDSAGCARISSKRVNDPLRHEQRPDTLHVAFPHWGPNYSWKTPIQGKMSERLTSSGYDMVIGHGAHTLQEISQVNGRWVIYSIGNGNFCSTGRWKRYEDENGILPFGLWTILEVTRTGENNRRVSVKMYPVHSNNVKSDCQPGPVDEAEFGRIVWELVKRSDNMAAFPGKDVSFDQDELGHFIRIDVADWPDGGRPHAIEDVQPQDVHEAMESLKIRVTGDPVQGVGYRRWLRKIARENNVSGWVRNREDGGVESLLHGNRASLDEVVSQMREGPAQAKVTKLQITQTTHVPQEGFRLR